MSGAVSRTTDEDCSVVDDHGAENHGAPVPSTIRAFVMRDLCHAEPIRRYVRKGSADTSLHFYYQ